MKSYRKNAGIVLLNPENGKIFIGERFDTEGSWQMPQGGVAKNESYKFAAKRELREEVGTGKFEIIKQTRRFYFYQFPDHIKNYVLKKNFLGQKQLWFLAIFKGTDSDIRIDREHKEFVNWRWEDPSEVLNIIIEFKKVVYKSVFEEFDLLNKI